MLMFSAIQLLPVLLLMRPALLFSSSLLVSFCRLQCSTTPIALALKTQDLLHFISKLSLLLQQGLTVPFVSHLNDLLILELLFLYDTLFHYAIESTSY